MDPPYVATKCREKEKQQMYRQLLRLKRTIHGFDIQEEVSKLKVGYENSSKVMGDGCKDCDADSSRFNANTKAVKRILSRVMCSSERS